MELQIITSFQFCILLVWSATLRSKASSKVNLDQMTILTDGIVRRHPTVRCELNMEILDLLNEESVSGAHSGRASL